MAFKGKEICNSKSGQAIRFIQTSKDTRGALLEMETIYAAYSKEPVAHYHPYQTEDFVVLKGELTVKIEDEIRILKRGDAVTIPATVAHAMWNNSNSTTIVNWKVRPALNTEYMLETAYGLAADHKTKANGMPGTLQIMVMMKLFSSVFRLARPPYLIQKIVLSLVSPVAYLFGYRAMYSKYID
ncbi:MAG TPA: cupin domain-containing protein [Ohtaekwangia sp.]